MLGCLPEFDSIIVRASRVSEFSKHPGSLSADGFGNLVWKIRVAPHHPFSMIEKGTSTRGNEEHDPQTPRLEGEKCSVRFS